MANIIGELVYKITGDTSGLEKGLATSYKSTQSLAENLKRNENLAKSLGKEFNGLAARQDLLKNKITELVNKGIDPSNKGLKKLSDEYSANEKEIQKNTKSLFSFGTAAKGAFLAAGVAAIAYVKKSVAAADVQLQAEAKLLNALGGRKDIQESLMKQASELQSRTTFGDEAIISQQGYLAALGLTETQIKDTVVAATELSSVTGMSLESSVRNLAKTYGGLTGELGESLPILKGLTAEELKAGKAIEVVNKEFKGFAEQAAKTGLGPAKQLDNALGDLSETVGKAFLPALQYASTGLTKSVQDLTSWLSKLIEVDEETKKRQKAATQRVQEEQKLKDEISQKEINNLVNQGKSVKEIVDYANQRVAAINGEINALEDLATSGKITSLTYNKRISELGDEIEQRENLVRVITKQNDAIKKAAAANSAAIQRQQQEWYQNAIAARKSSDDLIKSVQSESVQIELEYKERSEELIRNRNYQYITQEKFDQSMVALAKIREDKIRAIELASVQKKAQDVSMVLSGISGFANTIGQIQSNLNQDRLNELDERFEKEKLAIEKSGISEVDRVKQIAELEEKYNEEKRAANQKAAQDAKAMAIFVATLGAATSISNIIGNSNPLAWPILLPFAIATGIAQIAAAATTPVPRYATGGIVPGNSYTGDTQIARVNSGEMILNQNQQAKLFNTIGEGSGSVMRVEPMSIKATFDELFRASQRGELFIAARAVV